VTIADSPLARLRGLLGKMRMKSNEALWVVPSRGIHTIGLMFSIDLIYLDAQLRVIDLVEGLAPLRVAPIHLRSASVLQLPARSVCDSGTQIGDDLLICLPEEMERYLASRATERQATKQQTRAGG
jgi:uncharacterized membrane protein (UPF0127 family)